MKYLIDKKNATLIKRTKNEQFAEGYWKKEVDYPPLGEEISE